MQNLFRWKKQKKYKETYWYGNPDQIKSLKRIVQGPLQEGHKRCDDHTGQGILSKTKQKIFIKEFYDPDRNIIKICKRQLRDVGRHGSYAEPDWEN